MLRLTNHVDTEDEFAVLVPIVLCRKRWRVIEDSPGWLMLLVRVDCGKLCATLNGYLSTSEMLNTFHNVRVTLKM